MSRVGEVDAGAERTQPAPMKKALAIAVLTIQRSPEGPYRSDSDLADMKDLLDELIESDVQLEHYARAARVAVAGDPD